VTDVYAAVPDAHSQNIFAREIREMDLIFSKVVFVFADGDNPRRLLSDKEFDWVI
jgi:hypothetical protein